MAQGKAKKREVSNKKLMPGEGLSTSHAKKKNQTKKVGVKDIRLLSMSVLLASAYKIMSTPRLEMSCSSGYSTLVKTVTYECIQTVWTSTMMTLFVVYVEQYL